MAKTVLGAWAKEMFERQSQSHADIREALKWYLDTRSRGSTWDRVNALYQQYRERDGQ